MDTEKIYRYTYPRLVKGKKPSFIPKGSSLAKEWAKNIWYINYSFEGKQYRIKGDLNRLNDDHREKSYQAEILLESIKNDLRNGYNPQKPTEFYENVFKNQITINEAVSKYIDELSIYARPKTVQSYRSKLNYFVEEFNETAVKSITRDDIQSYIAKKIRDTEKARILINGRYIRLSKPIPWTPSTVKSAIGIFRAFFQWCISKNYFPNENPASKIEKRKVRSEVESKPRNIPFTKSDNRLIMNYLDENDSHTAFFCRFLYYTCLRPGEISKMRVSSIDLESRRITVPLDVTKNTKTIKNEVIAIEKNLAILLHSIKIKTYPSDYYLYSRSEEIIGQVALGSNVAYKRFRKALVSLKMDGKGYTLYSFKHFSNIQRYHNGWKLHEIMKANRHSSIQMTEKYLKNINKDTDISDKLVPII